MSTLRPELRSASGKPCPEDGTAYLMIISAVQTADGLIHGKLHARGESCAIGRYFDVNAQTALPRRLIDEVAAVNDSVPGLSASRAEAPCRAVAEVEAAASRVSVSRVDGEDTMTSRWAFWAEAGLHLGWITGGWWWLVVQHPEWVTFGH